MVFGGYMSIDISKAESGKFYSFEEQFNVTLSIFGDRIAEFIAPSIIKGSYVVDGTTVYINSYIDTDIRFRCDKCLEPVAKHLHFKFDSTYYLDGKEISGDYPYNNFTLDFTDAVEEQIMLNLPTKVVCSDECRGICPICGTNLNKLNCSCVKEELPKKQNPFSALKDFLSQDN